LTHTVDTNNFYAHLSSYPPMSVTVILFRWNQT